MTQDIKHIEEHLATILDLANACERTMETWFQVFPSKLGDTVDQFRFGIFSDMILEVKALDRDVAWIKETISTPEYQNQQKCEEVMKAAARIQEELNLILKQD